MVNKCPISLIKRKKYLINPQSLDEAICHIANIMETYRGEKRESTRNARQKEKKAYHCSIFLVFLQTRWNQKQNSRYEIANHIRICCL